MVNDLLKKLKRDYPWPLAKPEIPEGANRFVSFEGIPDHLFQSNLNGNTRLIVELGSWLGVSARFMLDHAPNAEIVCIDHWKGSKEHFDPSVKEYEDFQIMLPTLYEAFLHECWEYRDRIVPLRVNSLDGLKIIHEYGLRPEVIYVDASHEYEDVKADIELSHTLFPEAILIGDDYQNIKGVRHAVNHFMYENGFAVQVAGKGWQILKDKAPVLQKVLEKARDK